jgi:hypothetical protein
MQTRIRTIPVPGRRKLSREPVAFVGALNSIVLAVFTLAGVFGWWDWTDEQTGAVMGLWAAVSGFAMYLARANVTPTSAEASRTAGALPLDGTDG